MNNPQLLRHLPASLLAQTGCVATIGNFDGIHRGHQQVIRHVQHKAKQLGLPAVVISFEPLPAEYFHRPPPGRISPLRDKLCYLHQLDLDYFVCLRFDNALANMEAEDFVTKILLEGLKVRYLVVGDDFRFGYERRGNYALLSHMGQQFGMVVVDTPTFELNEQRVSSTWTRQVLAQGDLVTACHLLGAPYQLSGRVCHGDKRGRTIGFPTINLRIPENIALRNGVYAVKVYGLESEGVKGIANLGSRPTVNGVETRLEVHLFDFDRPVYYQHVCVEPLHFLRDEQCFDSLATLQQQIKHDVEQAHSLFHMLHYH
ncbi:MAG: bifunctional riboflavin kinase/FMN adenylyltransferase [Proteobacteria bacterium]|nr:MAG: bifunctional riboflavin kinase/FMN adenylyltransferase [Pseudomonadota bacterium]